MGLANGMVVRLSLAREKSSLIMDHKVGIRKIDYCHRTQAFSFVDSNFEFVVMGMGVSSKTPRLLRKGTVRNSD